jgi:hypothetical protein
MQDLAAAAATRESRRRPPTADEPGAPPPATDREAPAGASGADSADNQARGGDKQREKPGRRARGKRGKSVKLPSGKDEYVACLREGSQLLGAQQVRAGRQDRGSVRIALLGP